MKKPDRLLLGLALGVLVAAGPACAGESIDEPDKPCSSGSHLEQVQCISSRMTVSEQELDRLVEATLEKLPESGDFDSRKGKEQLRRAQAAWRAYTKEHCAFIGGIQGGSNLWVSHFASICMLDETNKRIAFFKDVPWGDH